MSTNAKTQLTNYDILARSNVKQHDLLLCVHKATKEYMTAEIDSKTRKIIRVKKFCSSSMAYQDYFTRIATPLDLDKQSLSLLLVTPEIELEHTDNPRPKLYVPNRTTQQGNAPISPYDRNLIPSFFYTQSKVPEWLEAARTMILLNSGTQINAGEQFKILAMHLKPDAKATESTIHLESIHGQRIEINLSTACSCFLRGFSPPHQSNQP